jgi:hypothetical protein
MRLSYQTAANNLKGGGMDLDQITEPLYEDQPIKQYFKGAGFLWFAETSWHYMSPRGAKEHLYFFTRLLPNYFGFRASMKDGSS